ncbi:MAG: endonuclease/exonuclease/phosphatase family protein [Pseudomonadota bacterium]|nr:endonuclease/exonuclease/phosphatase family protein [Pseudomonadota bacterium]
MATLLKRHPLKLLAAAVVVYAAAVLYANAMGAEVSIEESPPARGALRPAGRDVSAMLWNIGYAGLGAESDFVADGGEATLPPSRAVVKKNVAGVTERLKAADVDIIMMQEMAKASLMTRGVNVLRAVRKALKGRHNAFSADMKARLLPPPLGPTHGLFTSTRLAGARHETVDLPLEPGRIMGLFKRRYHIQIVRAPIEGGGEWVFIDLHLSAFDEGANIRLEQLRAVLAYAAAEYEKGGRVVIGGDWNYEFLNPGRATTTGEEFLFWLHPFPYEELREGWSVVVDSATPTVRTNERPYRKGENYTTVIDGFIVSPNVEPVSVGAVDLDFQYTDHQPVVARFRAKG